MVKGFNSNDGKVQEVNVNIRMTGLDGLVDYLKGLPRGVKIAAMRAAAEYFIGNDRHGLRHEPTRVQHGDGNPYQWQSEKQRRAFFATDGFGGGIPYQRTGELSAGWIATESNSDWRTVNIENESAHSPYVVGEALQRGHAADGWRYYFETIVSNFAGAIRHAQAAVNALISKR